MTSFPRVALSFALLSLPIVAESQERPRSWSDRAMLRVEYGAFVRTGGMPMPSRHGPSFQAGLQVSPGKEIFLDAAVYDPPASDPTDQAVNIGLLMRFAGNQRFAPVRTYGEFGIVSRFRTMSRSSTIFRTVRAPALALGAGVTFSLRSNVDLQFGGQMHMGTARITDRYPEPATGWEPGMIVMGQEKQASTTARLNFGLAWRPR